MTKTTKPGVKPRATTPVKEAAKRAPVAKKPVREGIAFLIEDEMEKASVLLAAQAITQKLQDMAEDLAKVEADDLMPLSDQLRDVVGPEVASQFSDSVITQIRQLLDAVKGAKDQIDNSISGLETGTAPANDMQASAGLPPAPGAAPAPGATAPGAGAAPIPPAGGDEEFGADDAGAGDMPDLGDEGDAPNLGPAGRARKESASRKGRALTERTLRARAALRRSANPDATILEAFRRVLAETKHPARSLRAVSRLFQIDESDVFDVVRSAKRRKVREANLRRTAHVVPSEDGILFDIVDNDGKVIDSGLPNEKVAKARAEKYSQTGNYDNTDWTGIKKVRYGYEWDKSLSEAGAPIKGQKSKTPAEMNAAADADKQAPAAGSKPAPAPVKPTQPAQAPKPGAAQPKPALPTDGQVAAKPANGQPVNGQPTNGALPAANVPGQKPVDPKPFKLPGNPMTSVPNPKLPEKPPISPVKGGVTMHSTGTPPLPKPGFDDLSAVAPKTGANESRRPRAPARTTRKPR